MVKTKVKTKKRQKRQKRQKRWFQPGKPIGWSKEMSQRKRRRAALESRNGNLLSAARALQALANVSRDAETRRKARADARYFYQLYRRKANGNSH